MFAAILFVIHGNLCNLVLFRQVKVDPRAYARGDLGLNPLELNILQKLYYLRKGD